MKYTPVLPSILLCLCCNAAWAQTPEAKFTGIYNHGSVNSVLSLAILPDHTFCFAAIYGAMDIQAPGKWEQLGKDRNGIRLKFTRTSMFPSRFVLYSAKPGNETDEEILKPGLHINTAAFSMLQPDAVLGSSNSPQTPGNMAPLFIPGQNSFSHSETLPLKHRYLFLGYPDQEGHWQITRFDIGQPQQQSVLLNISEAAIQAGTTWEGRFHNGKLVMQQSNMGKPKALSKKETDEIRKNCLSSPDSSPSFTLIHPQEEYRLNSLPNKPAWFGRDENYGEDAAALAVSAVIENVNRNR